MLSPAASPPEPVFVARLTVTAEASIGTVFTHGGAASAVGAAGPWQAVKKTRAVKPSKAALSV